MNFSVVHQSNRPLWWYAYRWVTLLATLLVGLAIATSRAPGRGAHLSTLAPAPPNETAIQDVAPAYSQAATNLDGSPRATPTLWLLDPPSPCLAAVEGPSQDNVRADIGAYDAPKVDLSLPAPGFSWTIGRTFNHLQVSSSQQPHTSNGYQGWNWFQTTQPELIFNQDGPSPGENDTVTVVYGSDRFLHYQRASASSDVFLPLDGASGMVRQYLATDYDHYELRTLDGLVVDFLAYSDLESTRAAATLWRIKNPANNIAYVGDPSDPVSAIQNGYDSSGRILLAYDTAGRRYTYTYSTLSSSVVRLHSIDTDVYNGQTSTWDTIASVDYDYYTTDTSNGLLGDLRLVTATKEEDGALVSIPTYYHRYWTDDWSAAEPGSKHTLRLVLNAEGIRQHDLTDGILLNEDLDASTFAELEPYASTFLEYDNQRRLTASWTDGQCGCTGGVLDGTRHYVYEINPNHPGTSGYDPDWYSRTIVLLPDGSYRTLYFDEVGQPLSTIISDQHPETQNALIWGYHVARNTTAHVIETALPQAVNSYDHALGTLSLRDSDGLIWHYTRDAAVPNRVLEIRHSQGALGTRYLHQGFSYHTETTPVGAETLANDYIAALRRFPSLVTTATPSVYDETLVVYTFHADQYGNSTLVPSTIALTEPPVPSSENGSGIATSHTTYYDPSGRPTYRERSSLQIGQDLLFPNRITAWTYDALGNTSATYVDADTSQLTDVPSGLASVGSPFHHEYTFAYSAFGHLTDQTDPRGDHAASRRHRLGHQQVLALTYERYDATNDLYYGPVALSLYDLDDRLIASGLVSLPVSGVLGPSSTHWDVSKTDLLEAINVGQVETLTTYAYPPVGRQPTRVRHFTQIPSTLQSATPDDYNQREYLYDSSSRLISSTTPSGTIHRLVHDAIGRPIEWYQGTNDSSFPGSQMSGVDNMVLTTSVEYDGGADQGNHTVSAETRYASADGTESESTYFVYDHRGNVRFVQNPISPHILYKYDNNGRPLAAAAYKSVISSPLGADPESTTTDRLALVSTDYDAVGRPWRVANNSVDDSTGLITDTLLNRYWYDVDGTPRKAAGAFLTKHTFDRVGRPDLMAWLSEDTDTGYTDAVGLSSSDIVLVQERVSYDPTTLQPFMRARVKRDHDDYGSGQTTGGLDRDAAGTPYIYEAADIMGSLSITAYWFDQSGRLDLSAHYGDNGATDFDRLSTSRPSASGPNVVVTEQSYDGIGRINSTIDRAGSVHTAEHDSLGRIVKTVNNHVDGIAGGGANEDEDRIVSYSYTHDLLTSVELHLPSGTQRTDYIYGVDPSDSPLPSELPSNDLLREVRYADYHPTSAPTSRALRSYDAQGNLARLMTPSGIEYEYHRETNGRPSAITVPTVPQGVNDRVRRIEFSHAPDGTLSAVRQFDNVDGVGDPLDEIQCRYADFGYLAESSYDPDSAIVSGGNHVSVSYVHDVVDQSQVRLSKTDYPSGRQIRLDYLDTGGLHDLSLGRVSSVSEIGNPTTPIALYSYSGFDSLVNTQLPEPGCQRPLYDPASWAGTYQHVDSLGYLRTDIWYHDIDPVTRVPYVHKEYDYGTTSLLEEQDDHIHDHFDYVYSRDGLGRQLAEQRGTLTPSGITDLQANVKRVYSLASSWDELHTDTNLDGDFGDPGEQVDRTYGEMNELVDDGLYSRTYDADGRLVDDSIYSFEYDAFGRLVAVRPSGAPAADKVAEYTYNGLNQRVSRREIAPGQSLLSQNDPWVFAVYDHHNRVISEYLSDPAVPLFEYVYHAAGLFGQILGSHRDELIFCETDTDGDGALDRFYYNYSRRGDLLSIVNAQGEPSLWLQYSPFGEVFGIPSGDLNADGVCDNDDRTLMGQYLSGALPYQARADLDLNGVIDSVDAAKLIQEKLGVSMGSHDVGLSVTGNSRGYNGYSFYGFLAGSRWNARHRIIDSSSGQWNMRDPIGFIDGPNLYEYAVSQPLEYSDPNGFAAQDRGKKRGPSCKLSVSGQSGTVGAELFTKLRLLDGEWKRVEIWYKFHADWKSVRSEYGNCKPCRKRCIFFGLVTLTILEGPTTDSNSEDVPADHRFIAYPPGSDGHSWDQWGATVWGPKERKIGGLGKHVVGKWKEIRGTRPKRTKPTSATYSVSQQPHCKNSVSTRFGARHIAYPDEYDDVQSGDSWYTLPKHRWLYYYVTVACGKCGSGDPEGGPETPGDVIAPPHPKVCPLAPSTPGGGPPTPPKVPGGGSPETPGGTPGTPGGGPGSGD